MSTKKPTPKIPVKQQVGARRIPAPKQAQELTGLFQPGFWRSNWMPAALLMAVAFLLYGISIGYGYLMDDQLVIWDNIFVQKGLAGLGDIFSHDSLLGFYKDESLLLEGGRYRPLPLATFALEISLFGKDHPGIGHFINILLYGFTGVFIYRILLGFFPLQEGKKWFLGIPFLAALIFLVHPLHTEVVANIKSRDEMLALLGSLGALYGSMKYFDSGRKNWLYAAAGSLFLGLLSKENAMTFLAVIPLTLWMFTKTPGERIAGAVVPLLGAALLFIIVRYMALGYMVHTSKTMNELVFDPFFGMSGAEKYATIFLSLGWYLKLLFFPHPLTHDYYPYHVPKIDWIDWRALVSLAIYVALIIWSVKQMRNARTLNKPAREGSNYERVPAYSVLYYLLTISVVSNIFASTSTFLNERLAYMPSLAVCLLLAWLISWKIPEWARKEAGHFNLFSVGLLGLIILLAGFRVWTRLPDWGGKGEGLVTSAVRISENSYRANYYYAAMLYNEQYLKIPDAADGKISPEKETMLSTIEQHLNRSLDTYPGYNLAAVLEVSIATERFRQDRILDKLLDRFERLIQAKPDNGDMLSPVLSVLKSLKGSDPNIYDAFCHRIGYDLYFNKKQDFNGALEFLNLAFDNYPQDVNIVQDLMEVYAAMGNGSKAAEMRQRLVALGVR